jgi:hypothetical protein
VAAPGARFVNNLDVQQAIPAERAFQVFKIASSAYFPLMRVGYKIIHADIIGVKGARGQGGKTGFEGPGVTDRKQNIMDSTGSP